MQNYRFFREGMQEEKISPTFVDQAISVKIWYNIKAEMTTKILIRLYASIEILIGVTTIVASAAFCILASHCKPLNVAVFVYSSAAISTILGIGLLKTKDWARILLIFFSGYILLTKLLIFGGLLVFNGELFKYIPRDHKNMISIIYHTSLIFVLLRPSIANRFKK